jgi:sigma54-dependent transcription regulator
MTLRFRYVRKKKGLQKTVNPRSEWRARKDWITQPTVDRIGRLADRGRIDSDRLRPIVNRLASWQSDRSLY